MISEKQCKEIILKIIRGKLPTTHKDKQETDIRPPLSTVEDAYSLQSGEIRLSHSSNHQKKNKLHERNR